MCEASSNTKVNFFVPRDGLTKGMEFGDCLVWLVWFFVFSAVLSCHSTAVSTLNNFLSLFRQPVTLLGFREVALGRQLQILELY